MRLDRSHVHRLSVLLLVTAACALLTMCAPVPAAHETAADRGCVTPSQSDTAIPSAPVVVSDQRQRPYAGAFAHDAAGVIEISADAFGLPLAVDEVAQRYARSGVLLNAGDSFAFDVTIPASGDYTLTFDLAAAADSAVPQAQVRVDDGFPIADLERLTFPVFYRSAATVFPKDRYGNDALIPQERDVRWASMAARDVNFSQSYPLRLPLTHPLTGVSGGTNAITFSTDLMGEITLIGAGAGRIQTGFALLSDLLPIQRQFGRL